ncbi:MAG TPA: amidase [Pyrinomonadaceae bacterium]|nr:amidase [Pyrinomonadaceae bacterium]
MTDLTSHNAVELARLIRTGEVSPVAVAEAYLQRIEQYNPQLNAIVTLAPDFLERARQAEIAVMKSQSLGPLHGVPITIKDTIETASIRTTSGSRLRETYIPGKDAPAVDRLKKAGAIILGKTNTPEMAIPYETDNAVFGRTNNPLDLQRTPGGSSGGEAAAIAAHLSPAGLGSDLSGSIRVPAHFCGIASLKPTSGVIPMEGHFPEAEGTLSQGACIGPMARCVDDLSLLFGVLTSNLSDHVSEPKLRGVRVAWYVDDGTSSVTEEARVAVKNAAEALGKAGLKAIEARPPAIDRAATLWMELFGGIAAEQTRRLYAGKEELAGPAVRRVLNSRMVYQPAVEQSARNERDRLRLELLEWMQETPLLIAPVGATPAFRHESARVVTGGTSISVFRAFSFAQAFNVLDLPVVTVRPGTSLEGLPIGVQIVGPPLAEELVLATAAVVERSCADHLSHNV